MKYLFGGVDEMETDSLSVMELLDLLEDLLENAKSAPFSSKVLLDREGIYEILKDIRLFLPNEIKQSKWVMEERNKILLAAEQKAEEIIQDAKTKATAFVKDSEIVKQAKHESDEMRLGAMEYVDGLLQDTKKLFKDALIDVNKQNTIIEECYIQKIKEIDMNRDELRKSAKG